MDFKTYISCQDNEYLAVQDVSQQINRQNLVSIICYFTQNYSAEKLRLAFNDHIKDISIIGCSTCKGLMTERGVHFGNIVGIIAIYDANSRAYSSANVSVNEHINTEHATKQAIDAALRKIDRVGEVPSFAIIQSTPGLEEDVIKTFDHVFQTPIPMIGATAADNHIEGHWSIFNEDAASSKGVTIQLLFPSKPLATGFSAGYTPTELSGIVTKSDGREIIEIDDQPAQEKYLEWVAQTSDKVIPDYFKFHVVTQFPLGRFVGSLYTQPYYKLSHPIQATPRKGVLLFSEVTEGDSVTLMFGDREQLIERPARVIKEAHRHSAKDSTLTGAICIICAGAMLHLESDIESVYHKIVQEMEGVPFICPFTFGEQGRFVNGENGHGNLMISAVTFYSDSSKA